MRARAAFVALLTAAALGGASQAGAQMMGGGGMGFFSNGIGRGGTAFGGPADMGVVASTWLTSLHAQLQVTAGQEPAWQAFANAVAAQAAAMQSMRTQMLQSSALTTPQRMQLAEQLMGRRLDAMVAVADALTALYAQLTPAQRAILDQGFATQCGPYGLFGD